MTVHRSALSALLAATLALAACGDSDEDQVVNTVERYMRALADGDGKEACALMTSEAKAQVMVAGAFFGGGDCAKILTSIGSDMLDAGDRQDARNTKVVSVKIRGDQATAETRPEFDDEPTELRKKGGEWLIHIEEGFGAN